MPDDDSGQARPWYACAHPISAAIRQTMIYLPTHYLSYASSVPFSLERLHIAKTLNYLTYLTLSPPPVSIHTLRPPILHHPHTVIHQPGLPTPTSHRQRQPPSPSLPKVAQAHPPETGPRHTHLSPARGRRNHVRHPPQQSTPLSTIGHHRFRPPPLLPLLDQQPPS